MTELQQILPTAPLNEGFLLFSDRHLLPQRLLDLEVGVSLRAPEDEPPVEVCASCHFSARWWPAPDQPE